MLETLFESLNKNNVDLFIMYNHENNDKFFCKYITEKLGTSTIAFLNKNKIYLFVHELDKENAKTLKLDKKKFEVYFYSHSEDLIDDMEEVLSKLIFPSKILLSYSTMSDKATDVLTHGDYLFITKKIKDIYKKYAKQVRFSSSEKILYDIGTVKTKLELDRMKLMAKITSKIFDDTFLEIRTGMSEIEISELMRSITEEILNMYVGSNDIENFDFAWEIAPIVLTGENLTKGGHTIPSVKLLNKGDTIYFDFGIRLFFKDKMVLNTDMQRMGYALKDGEVDAPKSVKKVFNTLVNSIDEALDFMKPGVKAYKIDEMVRMKINKAGYPDYNHATGHAVGEEVHDIGAVIATRNNKRANFALSENSVYTLEPRIAIVNGGSIEEMIQVTKFGGIPLCKTQKKLYIIK